MGTLLNNIRKVYNVMTVCENCGEVNELSIPKGILVGDYLKKGGKCTNCGTSSLKLYKELKKNDDKPNKMVKW